MRRYDLAGVGAIFVLVHDEWDDAMDRVTACFADACTLMSGPVKITPVAYRALIANAHFVPLRLSGGLLDLSPIFEHYGVHDAAKILLVESGWEASAVREFALAMEQVQPAEFATLIESVIADGVPGDVVPAMRERANAASRRASPHSWN